ncbi:hypothetical protein A8W25_24245 [Streptomyces sp. ERV7]|uniref:hypothetical protein n=1 Tax=Streptomyces sp. ERV7 TaxID=1322334 RepID=UPI0007F4914D|nr:hypothetical protein [Streptomyces sp. ERV7]OAR22706.1 hypothetical protein A8W25_24245 [Streptomyces sp. ERV7]
MTTPTAQARPSTAIGAVELRRSYDDTLVPDGIGPSTAEEHLRVTAAGCLWALVALNRAARR